MAIPGPEEVWRNIVRQVPIPGRLRRLVPGFQRIVGSEMRRNSRRRWAGRRLLRAVGLRGRRPGARPRAASRFRRYRRKLSVLQRRGGRHFHQVVHRRARAVLGPPRRVFEKHATDYLWTIPSKVGLDGTLAFVDFSAGNSALEPVPTNAGNAAGGTNQNVRMGNEIFVHHEVAHLIFSPLDGDYPPTAQADLRFIVIKVWGDRELEFADNSLSYGEIFKNIAVDGIRMMKRTARSVEVSDSSILPSYKVLYDKTIRLMAPSDTNQWQRPGVRLKLPARTLRWLNTDNTNANAARVKGRIICALMQRGGQLVAGINEDPPADSFTYRWQLSGRVRRVWSDPQ